MSGILGGSRGQSERKSPRPVCDGPGRERTQPMCSGAWIRKIGGAIRIRSGAQRFGPVVDEDVVINKTGTALVRVFDRCGALAERFDCSG